MLSTYIYHQLPPTCFGACYIIYVICPRIICFLQCCYVGCAMNYIYFITQQGPLKNSVPQRAKIQLGKVNIHNK